MPGGNLYVAIERLESIGVVEIRERLPGHRTKNEKTFLETGFAPTLETPSRFVLNSEQEQALLKIENRLKEGGFETFLLARRNGQRQDRSLSSCHGAGAAGRTRQSYTDTGDLADTSADRSS